MNQGAGSVMQLLYNHASTGNESAKNKSKMVTAPFSMPKSESNRRL